MLYRALDRLFDRVQLGRPGQYLNRWLIRKLSDGRAVYLHHFVGSDKPEVVHDHPKTFTSIGLWGRYVDCYMDPHVGYKKYEEYIAPWYRSFPAEFQHHIFVPEGGSAWSLVVTGPKSQDWGFYPNGHYVPSRDFLRLIAEVGDENPGWHCDV